MPESVACSSVPAKTCGQSKHKHVETPRLGSSTPQRAPAALLWEEFRYKPADERQPCVL
jgi:hypothetical protein